MEWVGDRIIEEDDRVKENGGGVDLEWRRQWDPEIKLETQ